MKYQNREQQKKKWRKQNKTKRKKRDRVWNTNSPRLCNDENLYSHESFSMPCTCPKTAARTELVRQFGGRRQCLLKSIVDFSHISTNKVFQFQHKPPRSFQHLEHGITPLWKLHIEVFPSCCVEKVYLSRKQFEPQYKWLAENSTSISTVPC